MIYVVFTAAPSDKTWGLVRDTRTSIIGPCPWPDLDEAVSYYYLLDFEENWPGGFSPQPGKTATIQWLGDAEAGLPEYLSDIPEAHRYAPTTEELATKAEPEPDRALSNRPRRYTDPL